MPARPWVLVGCGYTGTRVAEQLAAAPDVASEIVVVRRRGAAAESLAARLPRTRARVADLAVPETLVGLVPDGAVVVHLAPPAHPDGSDATALAEAAAGAYRLIYVSSTGVYAPAQGAVVDEDWPLSPATRSGEARLAAERALRAVRPDTVVLRAAGIYGPGRGVVARLRAGSYRVVGDGRTTVSRVHVDDLAAAIILAGTAEAPGPVYNVADREPCPSGEYADAAALALGVRPAPRVSPEAVPAEVASMLLADRRISADRLSDELGWTPRYPSWREALIVELGDR